MLAAFGGHFGGVAPFNGINISLTVAAKFDNSVPEIQTPKVRSKFPETWIWDNVDLDG